MEKVEELAIDRRIPDSKGTISVTSSSGQSSLAAYAGKWVILRALAEDITIMLGTHTLTAGSGMVITEDTGKEEFYVSPDGPLTLAHIAAGNATLLVLYNA